MWSIRPFYSGTVGFPFNTFPKRLSIKQYMGALFFIIMIEFACPFRYAIEVVCGREKGQDTSDLFLI